MTQNKSKNFIKRHLPLIVAFLIPVFLLLLLYITREIWPFGDQMYLRSDMYHQYAPFLKLFQSTLKNGGSLLYSWDIGLGSNFLSTYAYYLASPLNWVVAILPSSHIPEIMSAFIFLKSGLMSAAFTYYLQKKFHKNNYLSVSFGVFYALSGYMAAYSWNVMWLDCLVLLPLLILGLERLVKEGRVLLYTVCFALAVISNYYIAIMLSIFTVLYFIYLMLAEVKHKNPGQVWRRIGRYVLYSVIGGLIGAVIFLPALMTLFGTASGDSPFPSSMKAYYNLLELFAHGTVNAPITMMDGYVPNIYCGILVFALFPLFWLNKGIALKKRIGKTILMGVMLFSFSFNIPSFIWHGFHFPNSLPSRQSFIYIFLVLVICYETLLKIRKNRYRHIAAAFIAAVIAVFVLQKLYDSEDYPLSAAYISAGFLVVYGAMVFIRRHKGKAFVVAASVILLLASMAEVWVNADATGYGTTSRVSYTDDNEDIEAVLNRINDDDFYRVEKYARRTKNDGAWSGYPSASVFSSVTPSAISDIYDSFGLQSGTNTFSYYGNTPLTSALLGVRYKIASAEEDDPFADLVTSEGEIRLYKSKYCLPLGFMVKETCQAEVNITDSDPFVVQNDFLDAAAGLDPVFEIYPQESGVYIDYVAEESGRLYFYVDRKLKTVTIQRENGVSRSFTSLECDMIIDAGYVTDGETLELTITDEKETEFAVTPAYLDEEALDAAIRKLGSEPMKVISYGDTFVEGEVTALEDGCLLTSIPYEKGWSVYVDGTKVETDDFYGAFIQIPLSSGTHSVSFRYHVPGLLPGLIISLVSLAVLVILMIIRKKVSKTAEKKLAEQEHVG